MNPDIEIFTPPFPLKTAVLFLVFNRLESTKRVFKAISRAKPPRLYIAADGARPSKPGEANVVQEVRDYLIGNIDWDCEVRTLFRDCNLGCKRAVSSAVDWFFDNEEMGIILEDDCLPSQSFFWYSQSLLEKYLHDTRIFLISGYNKKNIWNAEKRDYFFSQLGGIWGWASWRRVWEHYDIEMKDIGEFMLENNFQNLFGKELGPIREKIIYHGIFTNKTDTWDYQFAYAMNKNSGLACVPSKNLVVNIGFGPDATHTITPNSDIVALHEIPFPLRDNPFIVKDSLYDYHFVFSNSRLKWLKKLFY